MAALADAQAAAPEEAGSTEGWKVVEWAVQHEERMEEELQVAVACHTLAVRTLQQIVSLIGPPQTAPTVALAHSGHSAAAAVVEALDVGVEGCCAPRHHLR